MPGGECSTPYGTGAHAGAALPLLPYSTGGVSGCGAFRSPCRRDAAREPERWRRFADSSSLSSYDVISVPLSSSSLLLRRERCRLRRGFEWRGGGFELRGRWPLRVSPFSSSSSAMPAASS